MKIIQTDWANIGIAIPAGEASLLLQGLEAQRHELGPLADELIALLRGGGVTPPPALPPFRSRLATCAH